MKFFGANVVPKGKKYWYERRSRGSVLVLSFALIIPVVLLFLAILRLGLFGIGAQRGLSAAEAASLAAAADLSKIVVNDPYYGYVALSDYGPYGKATLAADGEPLPVLGINNVIATARLQTLIADQLNNDELRSLAQEDVQAARHADKLLADALNASVDPASRYEARDIDGNIVKPFEDALRTFSISLNGESGLGQTQISAFRLSLGWLRDGSDSSTRGPLPYNLSAMPPSARLKGNYRAFVDVPACGESFYFAGLSAQPSLADGNRFIGPDGKRFCSIVKVDADLVFKTLNEHDPSRTLQFLHASACAQPACLPDTSAPGVLALNFMHGLVPGITSVQDLLSNRQLNENTVEVLTADGGDFPVDFHSQLVSSPDVHSVKTISQMFATGFHDWLRTAHNKPRIDSVIDAVSTRFVDAAQIGPANRLCPNLFLEIDNCGRVLISNLRESPFYSLNNNFGLGNINLNQRLRECTYDHQNYAMSFAGINTGGYDWMMVYRDYTRTLGTTSGGKHAGQVLAGDPVNWCELSRFASCPEQAFEKGKGERALGLQVHGQMYDGSAVMLEGAHFTKTNGLPLFRQPRRSYYSGGLAAYFELSSPLEAE